MDNVIHEVTVESGRQGPGRVYCYWAACKVCGWVGRVHDHRTWAQLDGDEHRVLMAHANETGERAR
jgi:hypothetical protein